MPASDLTQGPNRLSRYDVVGERADGPDHFVTHVGLHNADDRSVKANEDIGAVHMRPPLAQNGTIKAHVVGSVPLTNDEIKEVSVWINEIDDEYRTASVGPRHQYIIDPVWQCKRDPNTGVLRYRRYSCAGFVLHGHREVGITLLNIDPAVLPEVDRQTIVATYPGIAERAQLLRQFGLEGNGPWRIVLAGYVLHALDRPTDKIRQEPYVARPNDERF